MSYITYCFLAIFGLITTFGLGTISLIIYGITGADRDAYGILNYLSNHAPYYKIITRSLFLLLYGMCSIYLLRIYRNLNTWLQGAVLVAQTLCIYIVLVSILKDEDVTKTLSILVYSGIPALIIWICLSANRSKHHYFVAFIFTQTLLFTLILAFPSLAFLDGSTYKALEGVHVNLPQGLNIFLPDGSFSKGSVDRYAQFHNPNALGLYATVAIAFGFSLLIGRPMRKLLAAFFLICGILGWLSSYTRGPLFFLLSGGLLIILSCLSRRQSSEKLYRQLILLLSCLIISIPLIVTSGAVEKLLSYLVPDSSNISVMARLEGYRVGLATLMNHPWLGVPSSWSWGTNYPHFLPLAFAVDFGILGGILATLLVFGGGTAILIKAGIILISSQSNKSRDAVLAYCLVLVLWGGAATNNLIAPILFWITFAEALILVSRKQRLSL